MIATSGAVLTFNERLAGFLAFDGVALCLIAGLFFSENERNNKN